MSGYSLPPDIITRPKSIYSGAEWLLSARLAPNGFSPLGEAVANLLGDVFLGIYHLSHKALRKVEWNNPQYVSFIQHHGQLATYDGDELTRLVVLCHDRAIRLQMQGKGPHLIELGFTLRAKRQGSIYERHPVMEDAIRYVRIYAAPAGDNRLEQLISQSAAWHELCRRQRIDLRKLREYNGGLAHESHQRYQANLQLAQSYRALAASYEELLALHPEDGPEA